MIKKRSRNQIFIKSGLILAVALLMLVVSCAVKAPPRAMLDAYIFPVRPGSDAWKACQTHADMEALCSVPQDVLDKMSTAGVVETALTCPLYRDIMAYNTLKEGVDAALKNSNELQELFSRQDAGTELLARYSLMDPAAIKKNWTDLEKGQFAAGIADVETLLSQDVIQARLTPAENQKLLSLALTNYQKKLSRSDVYSPASLRFTELIIESVSRNHYSAKDYLSYILTQFNTPVPVVAVTYELTPAEIAADEAWVKDNYPNAVQLSDASRLYNCHSFAWYTQTANNYWLDSPYWNIFIQDGSYIRVIPEAGDHDLVMPYLNDDHTAYLLTYNSPTDIECVSKWGQLPLMQHQFDYCPYDSSAIAYFVRSSNSAITLGNPAPSSPPVTATPTPSATVKLPVTTVPPFIAGAGQ